MRICLLVLALLPAAAFAADDLWKTLADADLVVQARVERIEGQNAVLTVEKAFKGRAPEALTANPNDVVGCFATQGMFAGDTVVLPMITAAHALERMKAQPQIAEALAKDPGFIDAVEASARSRGPFVQAGPTLRAATGELTRLGEVVQKGLALKAPTPAWAESLLELTATSAEGIAYFEAHPAELTPGARAIAAGWLRSGHVSLWSLERVLRWVAPLKDDGLTRAAMQVVRDAVPHAPMRDVLEGAVNALALRIGPADPRFAELEAIRATSRGK